AAWPCSSGGGACRGCRCSTAASWSASCARWTCSRRRGIAQSPRPPTGSAALAAHIARGPVRFRSMLGRNMAEVNYDAIVVGASFAGLAGARQLRGHVLLLDRNDGGAVQTSACGTPLWVPESLGVAASVLQVHERLNLRTPRRTISFDLSDVPFCTFDYRVFCEGLLAQTRARFLRAAVTGWADGTVTTTAGRFRAPIGVDCSGWRAAIVNGFTADTRGRGYSFGLETHTALGGDDGLWLLLDQTVIPQGLGWIFPVGEGSLVGLGSYVGRSKLR